MFTLKVPLNKVYFELEFETYICRYIRPEAFTFFNNKKSSSSTYFICILKLNMLFKY